MFKRTVHAYKKTTQWGCLGCAVKARGSQAFQAATPKINMRAFCNPTVKIIAAYKTLKNLI